MLFVKLIEHTIIIS